MFINLKFIFIYSSIDLCFFISPHRISLLYIYIYICPSISLYVPLDTHCILEMHSWVDSQRSFLSDALFFFMCRLKRLSTWLPKVLHSPSLKWYEVYILLFPSLLFSSHLFSSLLPSTQVFHSLPISTGVFFVKAQDSWDGSPYVFTTNSLSGTTTCYRIVNDLSWDREGPRKRWWFEALLHCWCF